MVNSGKDFAGKKVVIPKEIEKIELSGEWTPIGKARIDIHNGKNSSEEMVNSGKDFAGKKVVIPKEIEKIELSGEWTPIGKARIDIHNGKNSSEGERSFKGEFDGNGCEISGLRLKNIYADSNTLGLFGAIRNARENLMEMDAKFLD